jgi:hypothetical protein
MKKRVSQQRMSQQGMARPWLVMTNLPVLLDCHFSKTEKTFFVSCSCTWHDMTSE